MTKLQVPASNMAKMYSFLSTIQVQANLKKKKQIQVEFMQSLLVHI